MDLHCSGILCPNLSAVEGSRLGPIPFYIYIEKDIFLVASIVLLNKWVKKNVV